MSKAEARAKALEAAALINQGAEPPVSIDVFWKMVEAFETYILTGRRT